MRILFITLLILKISLGELKGQISRYEQLMSIVKDKAGLILYSKPPSVTQKLFSMRGYYEVRKPKNEISDALLNNLIEASKRMDTTNWKMSEFLRTVIVDDRSEIINTSKILKTWRLTNKSEIKKYRGLLNKWINTNTQVRQLNYLSKPILTDNEEYGLILTDISEGNLCCGGQITLYQYQSGHWKDLGVVYTWKY